MTASLLVAGLEMLGSTTNPEYRLARDFDFGEGEPDQATIESLYLDGEVIQGLRTRNRQMQLPVTVRTSNSQSLTENVNTLLQRVNDPSFEVQWTPDGGLPLTFDCYRAVCQRPRDLTEEAQGYARLILTFAARPFGRSPNAVSVSASAASNQLDSFATAPTGAALDTSIKYEGTGSAKATLAGTAWFTTRTYATSTPVSRTYGSSQNLSSDKAVTMRFRWPVASDSLVTATLTLTSAAGNGIITTTVKFKANATGWKLVSFPLTGNLGTLDLTAVTGYSLTISTTRIDSTSSTAFFWIDDQRRVQSSSALTTTTHGANLLLPATVGSARCPANLSIVASGGSFAQFLLHSPPADQDPDAQILSSLSTGSADQTVTIAADNANLRGTFSIVLGVGTASGASTYEITVTQKENGTAVGGIAFIQGSWNATGAGGKLIPAGEITLPLFDTPADNSLTSYTFRVNITSGSDRYSELMLLDTRGQTVYTDGKVYPGTVVYIDEPQPLQSGSNVYVSASDRTAAWSKLIECVLTGGPVMLEPGLNKMLAWVDAGTPTVTASYYPRWLDERVV